MEGNSFILLLMAFIFLVVFVAIIRWVLLVEKRAKSLSDIQKELARLNMTSTDIWKEIKRQNSVI
tara:strand:- start:509 stop:703 length:195 start_codon:yes stop_codon:yes gene_type:complete